MKKKHFPPSLNVVIISDVNLFVIFFVGGVVALFVNFISIIFCPVALDG